MNNKIIGFTISSFPIDHSKVDVFEIGLTKKFFKHKGLFVYLWGIGNINKCLIENRTYSLSFPLLKELTDRNVLIRLTEKGIEIENDWLGSIPIFYNRDRIIISTLINKTFVKNDTRIDGDGLRNYLDFGFCVFEHTPFQNVRFLRYFSKVDVTNMGYHILEKKDIFLNLSHKKSNTKNVISNIKENLNNLSNQVRGDIIIPTSGGFDSRLLNFLIKDKSRIRSFTYGLSPGIKDVNFEVAKAKKLVGILGIRWEEVKLKSFHKYCQKWFELFGCSTHLHGMYQMEFYQKLRHLTNKNSSLLSGIFNETWSGRYDAPVIKNHKQLVQLGNTHGINCNHNVSWFFGKNKLNMNFFENMKGKLRNKRNALIMLVRERIMLISYLLKVPDYLGFPSWSPFLNYEIADQMLRFPKPLRTERKWLQSYFEKNGILLEEMSIDFLTANTLDEDASRRIPIPNVNTKILKKYVNLPSLFLIKSEYSKLIKSRFRDYLLVNKLLDKHIIGTVLKKLNFKKKPYMKPFIDITVLKSLEMTHEMLLKRR